MSELGTDHDVAAARLTTDDLRALPGRLKTMARPDTDSDLIEQIEEFERAKNALCGAQARLAADLAERRLTRTGQPSASAAAELALARHESPNAGRSLLKLARTLLADLPLTYALLCAGEVNERRARIVATETQHLTRTDRLSAEAEIASRLPHLGDEKLRRQLRRIVLRLDAQAAARRRAQALEKRHVSVRNLTDGTAEIRAIVSEIDAAQVMESLKQAADTHKATPKAQGDLRTRGQVMADTLAERLTGRTGTAVPVAVNLVLSAETLLGDDDQPGHLTGYGPIPASVARNLVAQSEETRSTIHRIFAMPRDGTLIAMETTTRTITGLLRLFVRIRDDLCRTPWCNAPIRHLDHPVPARAGGETSAHNAQGLCETCNYAKETAPWLQHTTSDEFDPHQVETITPTGHRHQSTEPGQPGYGLTA